MIRSTPKGSQKICLKCGFGVVLSKYAQNGGFVNVYRSAIARSPKKYQSFGPKNVFVRSW